MAIPKISAPGHSYDVALPEPLSPSDAARVRRIFHDQAHGRMADAEHGTTALESNLLLGSILADRYLGRFHRSTEAELQDWLTRYGDQPDAPDIRALLLKRAPHQVAKATAAAVVPDFLAPSQSSDPAPDDADPSDLHIKRNYVLDGEIAQRVSDGKYATALRLIGRTKGLDPVYGSTLRASVARGLFSANQDAEAARVAREAWAAAPPGQRVAEAALIGGMAEWRMGRIEAARGLFIEAAAAAVTSTAQHAAAAYWAARAAMKLRDAASSSAWLGEAAKANQTFYGIIARRSLGWPIGLMPGRQTLSQADVDALSGSAYGRRAFALLQVGERHRAEQEMRCLWAEVKDDPALRHALLLVAGHAHLTGFAAQITQLIETADGIPPDELLFEVPSLRPNGGFQIDPALVYGMTRAESNFDPAAVSPAGALGLMQIMPATARSLTKNAKLSDARLRDPGFNLELGQRFVRDLAQDDLVNGSLIGLLCSYNAGLGNYGSWSQQVTAKDPLLFIESIPIHETRLFVQRALTYTWLYAARLGLPAPSLDDLIAGAFPRFTQDAGGSTVLVSFQ